MAGRHSKIQLGQIQLGYLITAFFLKYVIAFNPTPPFAPSLQRSGFSKDDFLCSFGPSLCHLSRKPMALRGAQDAGDGEADQPQSAPPFDLAALAGKPPENFVPADFLALHEMILGATARDKSSASTELTSIGSAFAEEMQRPYTNRSSSRKADGTPVSQAPAE